MSLSCSFHSLCRDIQNIKSKKALFNIVYCPIAFLFLYDMYKWLISPLHYSLSLWVIGNVSRMFYRPNFKKLLECSTGISRAIISSYSFGSFITAKQACKCLCFVVSLEWAVAHINWVKLLSHVGLFVTPWTVDCEASRPMGFSRQDYWRGLLFPSPGDLPDPGIKTGYPALQADSLPTEPPGEPYINWENVSIVTCT